MSKQSFEKRIITWKWGNSPTRDEYTTTRAFIFTSRYDDSFAGFQRLVKEVKKDFPKIPNSEITCSKVTQSSYMKGFPVVSFLLPDNTKHKNYDDWTTFDFNY